MSMLCLQPDQAERGRCADHPPAIASKVVWADDISRIRHPDSTAVTRPYFTEAGPNRRPTHIGGPMRPRAKEGLRYWRRRLRNQGDHANNAGALQRGTGLYTKALPAWSTTPLLGGLALRPSPPP